MMWQSYLQGLAVAAGLIIAIGSQNAFVLARSIRNEYPVSVAGICFLCDVALILLGVFGLGTLATQNPTWLLIARWGGILFLLGYALLALQRAWRPQALQPASVSAAPGWLPVAGATLAITLLNPHVYLDTVLMLGSLGAQQSSPGGYAAGAASASLIWFSLLAFTGRRLAPWLASPLAWRLIDTAVALMMLSVAARLWLSA